METIADIVREMREQANTWLDKKVPSFCELHDHWMITADRIEAVSKAMVVTNNTEVLHNLLDENSRLKAALKPVLECDLNSPNIMKTYGSVRDAQISRFSPCGHWTLQDRP